MKILLSGGGTAGHINPALAIADYAKDKDKDTRVLFVGTKKGLESSLVPKAGYDIKYVNVEGLKKEISLSSMISAGKMAAAVAKSLVIMKKFKPDIVVGTGGYVCVSSVIAAKILGIRSVVHEQNVFPGSAVKFLADKCDVTAISFEESKKYFSKNTDVRLTGNPIRPEVMKHTKAEAARELGIGSRKMILCFGGSLGAQRINDVMTDFIADNPLGDTVIYFATGKRDYERICAKFNELGIKTGDKIRLTPYIDNMDMVMNAADAVICRSGAITLAEICALGKPSVLIPSPNVTNDHQLYNAKALSDRGAAITIEEKDFDKSTLKKALLSLTEDDTYAQDVSIRAKKMGITDACRKIYDIIEELQ